MGRSALGADAIQVSDSVTIAPGLQRSVIHSWSKAATVSSRSSVKPAAETNRPAGSHFVDCRRHRHRLTVELDSYRYHRSRHAWEQDRRREREARSRGDEFRRYTYDDVFHHPEATIEDLPRLLQGSIRPRRIA